MKPIDPVEALSRFKSGIERALRGHDETPEYLLQRCRECAALCFSNGTDLLIVELTPIRGSTLFSLMVWCAATLDGHGGFKARMSPVVEQIACELGAVRVEFTTNRIRAAERILGPEWKPSHVTYERCLP